MKEQVVIKRVLKIIGILGYLLLCMFSGISAGLAMVAFLSVFNGSAVLGIVGTIGAGFLAWMFWEIRKDALV